MCGLNNTGVHCWGGVGSPADQYAGRKALFDEDTDGDSIIDSVDQFPEDSSEYLDSDGDGIGDNADTDDDNDGISDVDELTCGSNPLQGSEDWDNDGIHDCLDPDKDTDRDGVSDEEEIQCGSSVNEHDDIDNDHVHDCHDDDIDGDGVPNELDALPLDFDEFQDTDGDGQGNSGDSDDDNDGIEDWLDEKPRKPYLHINPIDLQSNHFATCVQDSNGISCFDDNPFLDTRSLVPDDFKHPTQLSVGSRDLCVLDSFGAQCWGSPYGKADQTVKKYQPALPDQHTNPRQIVTGNGHVCVLDDNGILCARDSDRIHNDFGQTTVPEDLLNPTQISAGRHHTCALDDNGVHCWGADERGQSSVPDDLKDPVYVSAGDIRRCALLASDTV